MRAPTRSAAAALALLWLGAAGGADDMTLADVEAMYPRPDTLLGEALQDDEVRSAFAISTIIKDTLARTYAPGDVRRDAHPKAHGCVRGEFAVASGLDPRLAKGAFRPGASYPAWVRFSNGNEDPNRSDAEGDGRGMAVKLMAVPGAGLLGGADPTNLDLIMISHPTFFVDDLADYVAVVDAVNRTGTFDGLLLPVRLLAAIGVRGVRIVAATTSLNIENPLRARYWSMVPYRLGEADDPERMAVKFSARPCDGEGPAPPQDTASRNFLRAALAGTLARGPACMAFLVQPRTSADMSVEDSRTEWPEDAAPFVEVARIAIPQQTFDTPERNAFCESLSFTPWRTLAAHRPLGAVNRARRVIYERISRFRRTTNDASLVEPTP